MYISLTVTPHCLFIISYGEAVVTHLFYYVVGLLADATSYACAQARDRRRSAGLGGKKKEKKQKKKPPLPRCAFAGSPYNVSFVSFFIHSQSARCGPEKGRVRGPDGYAGDGVYGFFSVFLGKSTACIFGNTPPWAIVTPESNLFNSSSLRIANWR